MTWRTAIGTLAVVLTSIVTAFWLINEPARMAEAAEGFEGRSIEAGAAIFENNCTRCHGPQGQGLPGLASGLNIPEMFDGFHGSDFLANLISAPYRIKVRSYSIGLFALVCS